VVDRIRGGEIFQANIARAWTGRLAPGADPFDLFARLRGQSPAPFSAYLRLEGRALVSNSPERFLKVTGGTAPIETQPIKGTRSAWRDRPRTPAWPPSCRPAPRTGPRT
jgi:para-aminobenzoate synthetase component 1